MQLDQRGTSWPTELRLLMSDSVFTFPRYPSPQAKAYRNTPFALYALWNKSRFAPVVEWVYQQEGKTFEELSRYFAPEDPFYLRRRKENATHLMPRLANETTCFRKAQEVYMDRDHQNSLLSSEFGVFKIPEIEIDGQPEAPRIWGWMYITDEAKLDFMPLMFDPFHVAWPDRAFHSSQRSICEKSCEDKTPAERFQCCGAHLG